MKHPAEVVSEAVRSVPVVESDWPEWVERWRGSGVSQREFCRRHGLALATFNRRAKALLGGAVACRGASQPSVESASWLEVRLSPSRALRVGESESLGEGFEVVLESRRRVRLGPQFDAEGLRRLIAVLESLPC